MKKIKCVDCGEFFTFGTKDQEYFKKRNFNEPVRCKPCKEQKDLAFSQSYYRRGI
ncbi:zinc-ribbon domain containing protein [Candidatus Daviesbacteria bacterium]|nr:zinc-ribbon domain containing protein [Candidatus Daviesbacteria bacterium]